MKLLHIADLFCGAGGTSTGAVEAAELCGFAPKLTAINHWAIAVETHTANHPTARHLCTAIDDVNPRTLYAEGELQMLWASPECTHHSVARGGKPINEQSRATAHCVIRWAEALRPNVVLVENVPEFQTWGPIDSKGRPVDRRKGELFHAWVKMLEACGYRVEWRVLCAADFGDPTTRRRLFIQAVRGRRRVVWPEPTHTPANTAADLFPDRRPYVAAREIIDWALEGESIYSRKRPLSEKTMARIYEGLRKFGLKAMTLSAGGPECPARPVDEPLGTVMTRDHRAVANPFIIPKEGVHGGNAPRSIDEPLNTIVTDGRVHLAQPFLVQPCHGNGEDANWNNRRVHSVENPLGTVPASNRFAVAQPFIAEAGGPECAAKPQSVEEPMKTVTTENHRALAQPMLICMEHQGSVRSVEHPLPTITTAKGGAIALAKPFLIEMRGTSPQQIDGSARSLDDPLSAVTAGGGHHGLVDPFLVDTAHQGGGRARSVEVPLPTVAGNRGGIGVCEPSLLPQQSDGALRPVSQPVPTVATDGAIALVEPFLVEYYGNGQPQSVDDPLGTATCKDRFALARPEMVIDGKRYLIDIKFRMLQPHELAQAQGFPKDYQFAGTKTEKVKQIGNAVPRHLARAIVAACLTQNSNVAWLYK